MYYSVIHFLMAKPYNCRCDKNKHIIHHKSPQHPDNMCLDNSAFSLCQESNLGERRLHILYIEQLQIKIVCVFCLCVRVCRHQTHPPLQAIPLPQCQCVSLGNDWDYVDFAVDGLHELHIQRLQTSEEKEEDKEQLGHSGKPRIADTEEGTILRKEKIRGKDKNQR